jgi:regulator of protease activity HflC (stomatin/prohibitin superfamily)
METILLIILFVLIVGFLIYRFGFKAGVVRKGSEIIRLRNLSYPKIGIIIIITILFIILVPTAVKIVPVGHALVIFNVINKRYYVSREGINYIPPIINRTAMYDLRRQEYTMSTKAEERRRADEDALWAPTSEGLKVGLDITCWYRLDPQRVGEIHQRIGPDFEEKVIRPTLRSTVRMVVSNYPVMEVYSGKREEIQEVINRRIKDIVEKDGFILDGIFLRNVSFSDEFAKAVELKQVAQQQAEQMKYTLEKEELEAQRKAIEAGGKAKAIEIVSSQLRLNPQYIRYLYVDKLADDVKVIVTDQPTLMDLKGILEK